MKTKKLIALLSTVTMFSSLLPFMPVQAEEEVFDGVYLAQDFQGEVPSLVGMMGEEPPHQIIAEADGNKYLEISPSNAHYGYKFTRGASKGDADIKIEFDFSAKDVVNPYIIWLSRSEERAEKQLLMHMGVLGFSGTTFKAAGQKLTGITFEPDKWYHYELTYSGNNSIKACISDKNDPSQKATYEGQVLDAVNSGEGIPNVEFDCFRFSYTGTIKVDNIKVAEVIENPISFEVKTPYLGNIFGKDDAKIFEVKLANRYRQPYQVDVNYKVITNEGYPVDKGTAGSFNMAALTTAKFNLNLSKVTAYDAYDLIFDVTARNLATGAVSKFSSTNYMFSIINNRAENEPIHKLTASVSAYMNENTEGLVKIAKDAGLSTMRFSWNWHATERQVKGQYDLKTSWHDYTYMPKVEALGVDMMSILGDSNVMYTPNGDDWNNFYLSSVQTDEMMEAFKNHVEWMTTECRDFHSYYEVFNESDHRNTPEEYCSYLKIVKEIVEKNDPDKPVIAFATSGVPYAWLESCFEIIGENWQDYFDGISVHPYDFDSGEWEAADGIDGKGWSVIFRDGLYLEKNQWLVDQMAKYGYQAPIYHTEVAISSTPGMASVISQAADLAQMYTVSLAEPSIEQAYWYCYENTSPRGSNYAVEGWRNANYGMIGHRNDTVPHAAKPAYIALAGFNKFLTNAELIDSYVENNDISNNLRAYRFKRPDGQQVISFWTEWGYDNVSLDLGVNEIEIFDMYTNSISKMKSDNGIYNFTSTFEPIYIRGEFTKLERVDANITSSNARIKSVRNDRAEITFEDALKRNLRIEVVSSPYVEMVSNTSMVNGKGKLIVNTKSEAQDEEPFEVFMYDENNNLVYYSKHHFIISDDALDLTFSTGKNPQDEDQSVIIATAENRTSGTALSGTVSADFTEIGGTLVEQKITNLKAGQKTTVYLDLPVFKYSKCIRSSVSADFGEEIYKGTSPIVFTPNFTAKYNESAIKTSAIFDEKFESKDWFGADDINAYYHTGSDWQGPEDCSVLGTILWDTKNLYVYCEVIDDIFKQTFSGNDMWQGDCIQLGIQNLDLFDGMDGEFTGKNTYNELGIALTPDGQGVQMYRWSSHPAKDQKLGVVENFDAKVEVTDGKTIYKIAIPWIEAIGEETVDEGTELMFSMVANDDDGNTREGFMMLTEGLGSSKNAENFSLVTLKK